jgi:hypothetical protein
MKSYTGHHTCSMGGGFNYVTENAPFISVWPKDDDDDPREPYLGEGYYFWEYDVNQAKKWGKLWYTNWYYIFEASINTTADNFLDLVGDKQTIGHFLLLRTRLIADKSIGEDFTMGEVIEYLKRANLLRPGLFPYRIIRAQDYKVLNKNNRLFFRRLQGYTYLDPCHIFCLLEKNDVILSNKRIIFQSRI